MDNPSRLSSMLTVLAGCLVVGVAPALAAPLQPTGDPSIDVPAIQAAVDAGGVIELGEGTFDFGDDGRVNITNDVSLVGEGDRETVILGGDQPFYVGDAYDVVFDNLWFRESYFNSIGVHGVSGDITVKDCAFTSARPLPYIGPWTLVAGVYISGDEVGNLTVKDSYFDILDNATPEDWVLIGAPVWLYDVEPAVLGREISVEVKTSEFVHHDSERAVAFWGVAGIDAVVKNNLFRKEASNHTPNYLRYAVMLLNWGDPGSLKATIKDNDIQGLSVAAYTAFWPEVEFKDNEVNLQPWDEAYTHLVNRSTCFTVLHSDGVVLRDNEISGEAASVFEVLGSSDEATSASNVMVNNDIEGLCAYYTTVWFDEFTHDNLYEGSCQYGIIDEGIDNQILCDGGYVGEPCAPAPRVGGSVGWSPPVASLHLRSSGTLLDEVGGGLVATTDVGEQGERAALPGATQLMAVSPSPFRGSAAVRYELASAGEVSIRVFDVAGRVIRELVNTSQVAGAHEVAWDGRADDGSRAAPGVYFVDLSAPGQPGIQQRVVLLE